MCRVRGMDVEYLGVNFSDARASSATVSLNSRLGGRHRREQRHSGKFFIPTDDAVASVVPGLLKSLSAALVQGAEYDSRTRRQKNGAPTFQAAHFPLSP